MNWEDTKYVNKTLFFVRWGGGGLNNEYIYISKKKYIFRQKQYYIIKNIFLHFPENKTSLMFLILLCALKQNYITHKYNCVTLSNIIKSSKEKLLSYHKIETFLYASYLILVNLKGTVSLFWTRTPWPS